jgi:hypothetical protein
MVQVVWYPRLPKILFRVVSPMIYCNDCVYGAHVLRNLATCQDLSLQYFLCWENAWRIATVDFRELKFRSFGYECYIML